MSDTNIKEEIDKILTIACNNCYKEGTGELDTRIVKEHNQALTQILQVILETIPKKKQITNAIQSSEEQFRLIGFNECREKMRNNLERK